jgi:hypothetical protein
MVALKFFFKSKNSELSTSHSSASVSMTITLIIFGRRWLYKFSNKSSRYSLHNIIELYKINELLIESRALREKLGISWEKKVIQLDFLLIYSKRK